MTKNRGAWSLQPDDQRFLRAARRGLNPECVGCGVDACGGLPGRQRIGESQLDLGAAVVVGDDVGVPEYRRAEITAHLHGGLRSGKRGPRGRRRLALLKRHALRASPRGGGEADAFGRHFVGHALPQCVGLELRAGESGAFVPAPAAQIDQLLLFTFDQFGVGAVVEGASSLDESGSFAAEEKLTRVAGVVLLDVGNGLVDGGQGYFRRDGVARVVARDDLQGAGLPRFVRITIKGQIDFDKVASRRHDDSFLIHKKLLIADHRRAQEDVRNVLLVDFQLEQFDRTLEVHETIAQQVLGFDAEQHVAVVGRHRQHHRRRLSDVERVAIDDDLQPARTVAQLGRRAGRDPDRCLGVDRRAVGVLTDPGDAIEALALGCELQQGVALGIGRQRADEDLVVLVAAELESPRPFVKRAWRRGKDGQLPAQALQLFPLDLAATRIDPHLEPKVTGDPDAARHLNRLRVGVECFEVHRDAVLRPVDVVLGVGMNVVALPGDANGVAADDLAS